MKSVVNLVGLEPTTLRLQVLQSDHIDIQWEQSPKAEQCHEILTIFILVLKGESVTRPMKLVVNLVGLEPTTLRLQVLQSSHWTTETFSGNTHPRTEQCHEIGFQ